MSSPESPYDRHDSSGYTPMPRAPEQGSGPNRGPAPPKEVLAGFWGFVVAAAVVLVSGLLVIGKRDELLENARKQMAATKRPVTDAQLDQLATVSVIIAVVVSVVIAGLFVLFAYKARAGRNWARIVLAVIAVLALIQLAAGNSGILGLIGRVVAILAAIALFLPNANAYFAARKRLR